MNRKNYIVLGKVNHRAVCRFDQSYYFVDDFLDDDWYHSISRSNNTKTPTHATAMRLVPEGSKRLAQYINAGQVW